MIDLLSLWKVLIQDMGQRCAVDTKLDQELVERRVKHEGLKFLTITLPAFGKAVEKWLDQGAVDQADCPGFRFSRGLPIFMGGFFRLVFDSQSGVVLDDPSIVSILALRQVCGQYGKMEVPASVENTRLAMEEFIATDHEVGRWEDETCLPLFPHQRDGSDEVRGYHTDESLAFSRIAMLLFHRVFDRVDHLVDTGQLTPKHGPGSTAEGLLGNSKFYSEWHSRLEYYFPSVEFILPNARYHHLLAEINFKSPEDESPVKVIAVPKTSKRPRLIAKEPVCMQYTQQALFKAIKEGIEDDYVLKRFLRLRRQEVNQLLAREGSITGTLATLDLSEASDRVSNELVRFLFGRWQHLDGAVQACRSRSAFVQFPEGEGVTLPLRKFASMGSALTFPVECMIFLIIAFVGIERSLGRRLQLADVIGLTGRVAVYGDDIIVPTDHVGSVVHTLESFGFKVNSQKSFWTGRFRESCGKDYYGGHDVSYVKFRSMWPDDRQCVEEVVSLVSYFNQVNDAGYTETAAYLRKKIRKLLLGYFPRVSRTSQILGEWDDVTQDITRMDPKLHSPQTYGWVKQDHIPANPLDGERALLKYFLKQGDEPYSKEHLQRSGRSTAVSIKLCNGAT